MALGILSTVVALLTWGKEVLQPVPVLLRALAGCCLVGLVLPYRWTGALLRLDRAEWRLLWALGIGPTLFTLGSGMHRYLHGPVTCTEHRVVHVLATGFIWRIELEDGTLADHPLAREHYLDPGLVPGDTCRICLARGLFGGAVMVDP